MLVEVEESGRWNIRSEWNKIPASMTRMLTTSLERRALLFSAAVRLAADLALARTIRWPTYSTMKDKKRPAMTMAEVVPSYCISPRQGFPNMREACV